VLQCVTACCSVLQHAAVCCSVLHRSRRRLESREVSHLCGYVCVRVCVRVYVCVCVCVCVQMCVLDSMPAALSREQRGAPFWHYHTLQHALQHTLQQTLRHALQCACCTFSWAPWSSPQHTVHNIHLHSYTHTLSTTYICTHTHTHTKHALSKLAKRLLKRHVALNKTHCLNAHCLKITVSNTHLHSYTHTHICTHTYILIHTYTHTHIHSHTHTLIPALFRQQYEVQCLKHTV